MTTLYLYEKDSDFRKKFKNSKGFCLEHYGMLYDLAPFHLSGQVLVDFTNDLNETFLTNFKRVQEDVSWFVDKHDYRNKEASWKNSKDSLPRAMTKVTSILSENWLLRFALKFLLQGKRFVLNTALGIFCH